jgi:hypothetical protein
MTPTAVGLVLVEGEDAGGEIMDQAAFYVASQSGEAAISPSDYVAGAMSRTRAMANGRQPHTIGVTYSGDSEVEASLLLKSLTDAGFDHVVAVRPPEAGEALARGIGRAVGYHQMAVCLLEPETVVVSMVPTHDGAAQAVSRAEHDTDTDLIDWLIQVFALNHWDPECLILVGSDTDLAALGEQLEYALDLPVFVPPEAEFALARGAALASARDREFMFGDSSPPDSDDRVRRRLWPLRYTAPVIMLAVGLLAFIVSIALVVGTPDSDSGTASVQRPASNPPAPEQAALPSSHSPVEIAPPQVPVLPPQPSDIPTTEAPVSTPQDVSTGIPNSAPVDAGLPASEEAPPPRAPEVAPTQSWQQPPQSPRTGSRIAGT